MPVPQRRGEEHVVVPAPYRRRGGARRLIRKVRYEKSKNHKVCIEIFNSFMDGDDASDEEYMIKQL